jgi:hypothetical protein
MNSFYKFGFFTLLFGCLGVIGLGFVAPSVLGVLFTPPISFGNDNCKLAADWALQKYTQTLLGGFVVGLIILTVGKLFFWNRSRKKVKSA